MTPTDETRALVDEINALVETGTEEIERLRARVAELERDARLGAAVREAVERVEDDHVAGHLVVVSATERSAYDEDDIVITEDKLDVLRAIDRVLAEEEEADDAS